MVVKLYTMDLSPPVRAAMMACDIFSVAYERVEVNLLEQEQMKPEFLKKNPLHSLPVLEDDDLILHDSHAIMMYLADAYGMDESWYPKNNKKRALVNQKLFFDTAILFPRLRNVTYSIVNEGKKNITQKMLDSIDEAYGFMEAFLSRSTYIAGEDVTIADLSVVSDISSLAYILPIDAQKFPKTLDWLRGLESQPCCERYNNPGAAELGQLLKRFQESNSSAQIE
ncbi:glutathione S-transferase 1-like [Trichoplusia ni]|uniref:Glutathione S-transferase 1-like n=1 Tax=Trichoplusia ni TaxID=7111 RepID=A0A7E5VNN1_TRINI|nr:glutathione S-transferase 1-like [Trichoplusia ni]XP_026729938.1 glutathione S-transferase 1-like [Trichoplusia ni]